MFSLNLPKGVTKCRVLVVSLLSVEIATLALFDFPMTTILGAARIQYMIVKNSTRLFGEVSHKLNEN